jgi:glycosyltransferase involved in cell wall biosynthesis
MNYPRVSIITSIFKSKKFIRHFLEDVARQTIVRDCELLLLDANSPENEAEDCLEFVSVFPNAVYHRLDKTYSLYETWNIGAQIAKAPLLTNWNTDDRRVFNSLAIQAEEMEADSSIDVCYGPTLTTHEPNENVEDCKSKEGFGCYVANLETMLVNNSPHCLPMWRKDLHQRFGYFNPAYPIAGDYEMWLRALVGGAKFKMVNKLIGSYYRNPTGLSSNPEGYAKALEEIFGIREIYRNGKPNLNPYWPPPSPIS